MNELSIIETTNFDMIYCAYQEDFPLDEQKSYDKVVSMIQDGKYKIFLAVEHDEIKAYAIGIEKNNWFWLDYLAVMKHKRGTGIGSRFLNQLKEKYDYILFEVELNDGITGSKKDRREKFYLKMGGKILNIPYEMPTKNGSMRMNLFILSEQVFNKEELKNFLLYAVNMIHDDYLHTKDIIKKYIDIV